MNTQLALHSARSKIKSALAPHRPMLQLGTIGATTVSSIYTCVTTLVRPFSASPQRDVHRNTPSASTVDPKEGVEYVPNTFSCDDPVLIPVPTPPKSVFKWSPSIRELSKTLVDKGYIHQQRPWVPYLYFTANGHEQGREQVETYIRNMPSHPTRPEPLPQLDFIPPDVQSHSSFPTDKHSASLISTCHFGPFSAGPPGIAHGGLNATVADVLMYRLLEASGRKGVTAALDIQYRNPVPLGTPVVAVSSIELTGPRKAVAHLGIFSEDFKTLFMESSGVFVTPKAWVGLEEFKYGVGDENTSLADGKSQHH